MNNTQSKGSLVRTGEKLVPAGSRQARPVFIRTGLCESQGRGEGGEIKERGLLHSPHAEQRVPMENHDKEDQKEIQQRSQRGN